MKKYLYLILLVSSLYSCEREDYKEEIAYYKFNGEDNDRLLDYSVGEIIKFKNQDNEELNFTVISNSNNKVTHSEGMGFFGGSAGSFFDYDVKTIILEPSTYFYLIDLKIKFRRFPNDFELAKENRDILYPSSFRAGIDEFPFWNRYVDNHHEGYIGLNYENSTSEMLINNFLYEDVLTLQSNNPNIMHDVQDVHIIYYDKHYGIIGFDDLNGKEWRLID